MTRVTQGQVCARLWIKLAKILGTDLIAIPSTCLPEEEVSGDFDLIAGDLREVADLRNEVLSSGSCAEPHGRIPGSERSAHHLQLFLQLRRRHPSILTVP